MKENLKSWLSSREIIRCGDQWLVYWRQGLEAEGAWCRKFAKITRDIIWKVDNYAFKRSESVSNTVCDWVSSLFYWWLEASRELQMDYWRFSRSILFRKPFDKLYYEKWLLTFVLRLTLKWKVPHLTDEVWNFAISIPVFHETTKCQYLFLATKSLRSPNLSQFISEKLILALTECWRLRNEQKGLSETLLKRQNLQNWIDSAYLSFKPNLRLIKTQVETKIPK